MQHARIALYVQMLAFRTGRAWPEAIRVLAEQGFVSAKWGVPGHHETESFDKTLAELEDEYVDLVTLYPNLAPLALPADPDPVRKQTRVLDL